MRNSLKIIALLLYVKCITGNEITNEDNNTSTKLRNSERAKSKLDVAKEKRSLTDDDDTTFWANRGRRDFASEEQKNAELFVPNLYNRDDLLLLDTPGKDRILNVGFSLSGNRERRNRYLLGLNQRSMGNENKQEDLSLPAWPTRGRREIEDQLFWGNIRQRQNQNQNEYFRFIEKLKLLNCLNKNRRGLDEDQLWRNYAEISNKQEKHSSNRDRKNDDEPFWGNRGRRDEDTDPFWGNRGRRDGDSDPIWGNKGQRDGNTDPFWGNRGRRDDDTDPFWGNRGRRDDDTDRFWGNRGRRDDDDNPFWGNRGRRDAARGSLEGQRVKQKYSHRIGLNDNNSMMRKLRTEQLFVEEPDYVIFNGDYDRESRSMEDDPFFISRGKKKSHTEDYRFRRGVIDQLSKELNVDPFFVTRGKRNTKNSVKTIDSATSTQDSSNQNISENDDNGRIDLLLPSPGKKMLLSSLLRLLNCEVKSANLNRLLSNTRARRALFDKLTLSNDPYFVTRGKKYLSGGPQMNSVERRNVFSKLSDNLKMDPFFVTRGKKYDSYIGDLHDNELLRDLLAKYNQDTLRTQANENEISDNEAFE